jgi:predicted NBD/HSP70 family sugar kinase
MVDELSCDPPGRGPLETRQDAAFVLGIDLGGTKLHAALADAAGTVLGEALEPTDPRGGLAIVAQIGALRDRLAREAGLPIGGLRCAVLGSPGVFDPRSGRIGIAPNIPDFDRIDIVEELGRRLGCPVQIENDVNLAAMGEQWQGCCKEVRDFAFVALGTGIGLGLVLDGRLVRGARGAAGEIAFLPIGSDPAAPRARLHGAFETAVGSAAILERYRGLGGSAAKDVRGVFDALAGGDEAAAATLDETARLLVQGLMAVRAVVDPALIVLGGSIGVREELVTRVRNLIARHPGDLLRVEPSMLGSRAAVIGAVGAALARFHDGLLGAAQPAGRRS